MQRTTRRTRTLALFPLALLSLGATQQPAAPIDVAESTMPAVQWTGPHSNITTHGYHRITDTESWTTLWESHRGDVADHAHQGWVMPPVIDFERYMVIAFFRGQSTNTNGELARAVLRRADPIERRDETLVVRFDSITFQTASFDPEGDPGVSSTPYGIWVVERFDGPVLIEEDRNRIIGSDPDWQEAHRFPARTSG